MVSKGLTESKFKITYVRFAWCICWGCPWLFELLSVSALFFIQGYFGLEVLLKYSLRQGWPIRGLRAERDSKIYFYGSILDQNSTIFLYF
jgi:hypothetical protein